MEKYEMENKEVKVCAICGLENGETCTDVNNIPLRYVNVLFNEDVPFETAEELMDVIIAWVEARGLTIAGEVGIKPPVTCEETAELEKFWEKADAESEAEDETS
jgi:hypothetical protein